MKGKYRCTDRRRVGGGTGVQNEGRGSTDDVQMYRKKGEDRFREGRA
jgi:hypothetical protein